MRADLASFFVPILFAIGCGDASKGVALVDTSFVPDTAREDTGPCEAFDIYYDGDGDGYGDSAVSQESCVVLSGWSAVDGDCDDADSSIWEDCPEFDCTDLGTFAHPESEDTGAALKTSQYWSCQERKGWSESNQFCYDTFDGAYLSALNLPGERESLAGAGLDTGEQWWLGLQQESTSPADYFGWFWNNAQGSPENLQLNEGGLWHLEEPNNGGYDENEGGVYEEDVGALVYRLDQWGLSDVIVDQTLYFICEKHLD